VSAISVRQARETDAATVAAILQEAASWLAARGEAMWRMNELAPESIAAEVAGGLFWIAARGEDAAGVVRFQLDDVLMWPDARPGEAGYVHRLAVRRSFSGGGVSRALLDMAADQTRALGRELLRLDCEAGRPRLRAVYERYGFAHHSDFRVGPYLVARYELRLASGR
jgi:GNAT superfamily N-acetyltransferase